ncbi:TniB family NTP-binding protein [Pseudomonas aeruginosa]|uniref:TniB family NTP-binding protein n=1 Tax=Pseudomonas aeruginosa TaxID=287 RepID=UPI0018E33888|nr:TniB family NTP-binding protein [Pseudomonas aeruginosa]MBX5700385.1 TniB family NTP-binding protein [Pseudomonas aeruginosa]MDA3168822.1 TniB family NTP-binding protein [Pseudomonas aeruginosa]MDU0680273.1 TniB family NTP-binding protein [Pseudomonas aeruginosa]QQD35974.1 TniB family NTP-binding protein [Pseudomonas aeruginosa]UJB87470.1 TniB family NTP-binding protein [Pseudomonas aeruginosa]
MNSYSHVLPEYRGAFALSDQERLESIRRHWIDHEFADKLFKRMAGKLLNELESPDLMICGESDMGKTTLMKRFMSLYGNSYIEDESVRVKPVLMIEISKPSVRDFYCEILRTSIAPYDPKAPEAKLRKQAVDILVGCKTKMLIIDEIQVLFKGTARVTGNVMDEIKWLGNSLDISIILVGMPTATSLLNMDRQYANRFVMVEIPAWGKNAAFRQFLKAFESWLPLKKPSDLASPAMAGQILARTGGNTGHVENLLLACARRAIETGKEKIDVELLESEKWVPGTNGIRKLSLLGSAGL